MRKYGGTFPRRNRKTRRESHTAGIGIIRTDQAIQRKCSRGPTIKSWSSRVALTTARRAFWISSFVDGTGKSFAASTSNERGGRSLLARYCSIVFVFVEMMAVSSESRLLAPVGMGILVVSVGQVTTKGDRDTIRNRRGQGRILRSAKLGIRCRPNIEGVTPEARLETLTR